MVLLFFKSLTPKNKKTKTKKTTTTKHQHMDINLGTSGHVTGHQIQCQMFSALVSDPPKSVRV